MRDVRLISNVDFGLISIVICGGILLLGECFIDIPFTGNQ
jgi:hypothetical protein